MRLLVISGLSGSGKSIALQALEDLEFYCVDNLPVSLLPDFTAQMVSASEKGYREGVAVGIDARNITGDLEFLTEMLDEIKKMDVSCEVIFLEANKSALLKRFSETRRKHPLTSSDISLVEAIEQEKKMLEPVSTYADLTFDTSHTNVHQLRDLIRERVAKKSRLSLSLQFVSFGFKNGIPEDADFIFDVRCLPNPHWEPRIRMYTGKDPQVIDFLQNHSSVNKMQKDITAFLDEWIPCFESENRSYITIALGCTGGQHRSVYLAEALTKYYMKTRDNVMKRHRDLS